LATATAPSATSAAHGPTEKLVNAKHAGGPVGDADYVNSSGRDDDSQPSGDAPTGGPLRPARRHRIESNDRTAAMTTVAIDLETLSAAERRDLANALLRAAWSATLAETRILLLDLLTETDAAAVEGPGE
jgi:hypothetical protein